MNWHQKSKHKYGAQRTIVDDITFDSKAEAEFYGYLKLLERAYEIKIEDLQPKLYLSKASILYKPDFKIRMIKWSLKQAVYIDVKGMQTDVFRIKTKLWKAYVESPLILVKKSGKKFKTIEKINWSDDCETDIC